VQKLLFYYRVSAEAGIGKNMETGEPTAVYLKVDLDVEQLPEDYEAARELMKGAISEQLQLNNEWLTPISEEEYNANQGEDE